MDKKTNWPRKHTELHGRKKILKELFPCFFLVLPWQDLQKRAITFEVNRFVPWQIF